jgi:PHIKZ089
MSKLHISSAIKGASPALEGIADVGLSFFQKATAKGAVSMAEQAMNNSLVEATKTMRVQPITVIDHTLIANPILPELNSVLLNIFVAYYLQAVARDNTIGNISVFRRLDRLNPHRSVAQSVLNNSVALLDAMEGYYDFTLPALPKHAKTHAQKESIKAGMESLTLGNEDFVGPQIDPNLLAGRRNAIKVVETVKDGKEDLLRKGLDKLSQQQKEVTVISDNTLKDLANLAIGKIINIELSNGQGKVKVPVAFRLMTSSMVPSTLIQMLSYSTRKSVTLKERWHAYRSGRISFWQDFIFARDRIREEIRHNANSKDKIYQKIQERKLNNSLAGAATGNPTMANISNIIIINKATLSALESEIGGRLTSFAVREKLFADSGIMIFVVVDTDNNRVRMYFHSIEEHTDMSFNEITRDAKKDNTNLTDLLQMLMQGSAPRL